MEMDWLLWLLMWIAWLCWSLPTCPCEGPGWCIICSCWTGLWAMESGCGGPWWTCRCSIASLLSVITCMCSCWPLCVIWPSSTLIVWIWGVWSPGLPWVTSATFCMCPDGWVRRVSLGWAGSTVSPSVVMMLISCSWPGTKLMLSTSPVTTSWISCSELGASWYGWSCRMLRTSSGAPPASAASEEASAVWTLSLLWVLVCVFRLSRRVKERLQKEQVKGFFPEWEATCRLLALGSENDLSQMLQLYGLSPLQQKKVTVTC